MESVQLENYNLVYLEKGAGEPVIFVHGSLCDYRNWDNQFEHFSRHYHAITYSRRYHFPNTPPTDSTTDYDVPLHSKDLIAFIQALNLGPVHLVGSSYGAFVGFHAALQKPELFKTLVLGEPPVLPMLLSNPNNPIQILSLFVKDFQAAKSLVGFGVKVIEPAKKQFKQGNLEEGLRTFTNGVLGEGKFDELPERVKQTLRENAPALKAEMLGPGFPGVSEKAVAQLQIPTLLLCGKDSVILFHSISKKLHKLLPKSELKVIPNATHDMHQDNPKEFNKLVFDFLKKH
jgi:non-heme chloroperoxidase